MTTSSQGLFFQDTASDSTPGSSRTHFSAEARAISRILEKFPATAPVISTDSVLLPTEESPKAPALAATLASQIRHSGLFYESHLRQWLLGQYNQQALLKEPQNRFFQLAAAGSQTPSDADPAYDTFFVAMRERPAAQAAMTSSEREGVRQHTMTSGQDDLQGVLRHQLELMTSSLVRWEGFLTPQIPVHWEIEQQFEAADSERSDETPRIWRSKLRLTLPTLGHVDLEISLQDKVINVSGRVELPHLAWMTVQGRQLDERMAGAGLQLANLHFTPQGSNDHGSGTT
ncbi:flagellar hook-length control protein FliK [Kushneria marisflavi]|uniref:flagellar hook-length control protein FliK n=1 Tax=Kushneria marisflavi TaxID=157779 RepID=UPI0012FCCFA9|nr:flagellar hook-length control protein FliK [Kushneria marisflavi]